MTAIRIKPLFCQVLHGNTHEVADRMHALSGRMGGGMMSGFQSSPGDKVLDNERLGRLLARVALHDRGAFRELYDASASHLFGVAVRILNTRALAEEALQDGFVQIWQNAATFRAGQSKPTTWMTSIVRYRALDLLRRHGREVPLDDVADSALPTVAFAPAGGNEPELVRCMDELAERQRACITLAFVEGYSHQELSRRFSSPLGTIKSWIRRGLGQLKECLER